MGPDVYDKMILMIVCALAIMATSTVVLAGLIAYKIWSVL